jgi:hypothetical protein
VHRKRAPSGLARSTNANTPQKISEAVPYMHLRDVSPDRLVTSRQVFTKTNAGRDFDWRPRAQSSAMVASTRGPAKPAFDYIERIGETTSPRSWNRLHPIFLRGCSWSGWCMIRDVIIPLRFLKWYP